MKNALTLALTLFISGICLAQGIKFEKGSWTEVLAKAKKENKTVFVDVYTTWCGPCKVMSDNVFPLKDVGETYNKNFVSYKLDAEKGEGVELAKKYQIRVYPTYLFIKPDGSIYFRKTGSMSKKEFIHLATLVQDELNSPKPFSVWEQEYLTKKKDTAFLRPYMQKRYHLGLRNDLLLDEYLIILPRDQRASQTIANIYINNKNNFKITSLAFKNLKENGYYLLPKIGQYNSNDIISNSINNSLQDAIKNKDEQVFNLVLKENSTLAKGAKKEEITLRMKYLLGTGEIDKYTGIATKHCNENFMNIGLDSINKLDSIFFKTYESRFMPSLKLKADSSLFRTTVEYMKHSNRNRYVSELNKYAWSFFENVINKKDLEQALAWSKRSIELDPNNHTIMDTYANLLYKLGMKKEAIEMEKQALAIAKAENEDYEVYEKTLKKMNLGKPTW